jgi:hypothetical protein
MITRRWRRFVIWLYAGFVPDGYAEHGGRPWAKREDAGVR